MPLFQWGSFWYSTCLKPTYSLRRQLLVSFGVTGIVTTSLVVALACFCAISAGILVRDEARSFMGNEVIDSISNSSQFAAETFSQELDHLRGTVALITEIVRDRIAGYPRPGWEDDSRVPFPNFDGRNQYPLKSPLLPRDWNVNLNVNLSNYNEHLQDLCDLLEKQHGAVEGHDNHDIATIHHLTPTIGTASATYFFQGNCDPTVTNPSNSSYYRGCTDANNNAATGGVIWPTSTSAALEPKAADIGLLLKPIWESRPDLLMVSVHFVNEGAGSVVHFPSFVHGNDHDSYESIGCDWLYDSINPRTGKPFLSRNNGTSTAKCHPNGTMVHRREFNPMEQDWCRQLALHPDETQFYGPIVDSFFTPNVIEAEDGMNFWLMRVGRAVFDRYTDEFIGCVAVDVLLNRWTELILETLAVQNYSNAVLVRADDGKVVAGGDWSLYNKYRGDVHVTELKHLISIPAQYDELMKELEKEKKSPKYSEDKRDRNPGTGVARPAIPTVPYECTTGRVLSASALPGSNFIYIQTVGEEIFDIIDEIKSDIDKDVIYSTLMALTIGGIGMAVLMVIVWTMSKVLTRPLNWMQYVAWSIVNHSDASVEQQSLRFEALEELDPSQVDKSSNDAQDKAAPLYKTQSVICTPNSEVTELVQEFKQMIRGFSGAEKPSTVAKSTAHEVRNTLSWQSEFERLYMKSDTRTARAMAKSYSQESPLEHNFAHLDRLQATPPDVVSDTETSNISESGNDSDQIEPEQAVPRHVGDAAEQNPLLESSDVGEQSTPAENEVASLERKASAAELGESSTSSAPECLFRSLARTELSEASGAYSLRIESAAISDATGPTHKTPVTTTALWSSVGSASLRWKNEGRNLYPSVHAKKHHDHESGMCIPIRSSLFRRILILIVLPMIFTNVVIIAVVTRRITTVLPRWLEEIEEATFGIHLDGLSVASKFAALYAEAVLATPVRDLFVFTRVAEWLYTDAIERRPSAFVEMVSGAEECKAYEADVIYACPWYDDFLKNAPCDCSWEEPPATNCFQMGNQDTRDLQKLFFAGQRHDADPFTGARLKTSYPKVDDSAANTSWWANVSSVPGAIKGQNASGAETTYDRLRVFSALSTIMFPLYNYRSSLVARGDHRFLGTYFGFEADGMIAGWAGCLHPSTSFPQFQSSLANGASEINNDLCPLGKFGYDARCRGWYDTGKSVALETPNASSLYISPPYEFASSSSISRDKTIASSATQAIFDPRTGEYIGQTLLDFLQFEMLHLGPQWNGDGFHFVITTSDNDDGGDTVVGPGPTYAEGSLLKPIGDLVLPNDDKDGTNRKMFDEIVNIMKTGSSCLQNFTRTTKSDPRGGTTVLGEENIWLAYEPIRVRALDSVRSDDYARGLNFSRSVVYSLGMGQSVDSLEKAFENFETDSGHTLRRNVTIYIALTVLISLLATAAACRISVAVTRPMIILLHVVQNINAGKIDDDIPPLNGGSREVNQVYTSFAKLYKIVRVSNSAFFSRNLNWACHFVRDALQLFSKIDDRKAIAIASANLGSTLLAINCERPLEDRATCLEIDSRCCVKEALLHFRTAVNSGTEDFENAAEMSRKVEFAEQLSDRLFNRGLFYLLSQADPCAEEDFEALGHQDLMKARALDHDVQEYWINNGLLMQKSSILFERLLRRLTGLCALEENGVKQDIWGAKWLVYDCHRLLSEGWEVPEAPMFDEFSPIGRLQQLEGALIHLHLLRHEVDEAARIAMRMFVEDEFINECPFQCAADAVLQYMTRDVPVGSSPWSMVAQASVQRDFRNMLKACKQASLHTRKCLMLCMELCDDEHRINLDLRSTILALYDSHCGTDDFFGLVASNRKQATSANKMVAAAGSSSSGNNAQLASLDIECKRNRQKEQRSAIESTIDSLCESPSESVSSVFRVQPKSPSNRSSCAALRAALDNVSECEASTVYDSYILYVTDVRKRDWDWKSLLSLKSRIEEMNSKRNGDIHLVIVDFESVEDEGASSDGFAATCRNLCRVSQGSVYIKASLNNLEDAFDQIGRSLSAGTGVSSPSCSNALLSGITMEKF